LADRIRQGCNLAEDYVESVAQKEKAEYPSIPLEWQRLNLKLTYGSCACRAALALLEKESDGK
jgi:hypothetical protein